MTDHDNIIDIPSLQWYPGHMRKAERLVKENLKLVDVVVELLDARIPMSSANPILREIVGGKPRVIVLNKADLADETATRAWIKHFAEQGITAVPVDAVKGRGVKELVQAIAKCAKPKTDKLVQHGAKARAARCMILGIPNVGKSSLINRLSGGAKTKVENRPGRSSGFASARSWSFSTCREFSGRSLKISRRLFTSRSRGRSTIMSTMCQALSFCFWIRFA